MVPISINRIASILVVAGLTVLPSVSRANGMRLVSQDALAAARGEAFVATADNPSAIHYNPAGITQLAGRQFRTGLNALYFDPTFRPPSGAANAGLEYSIDENRALAPQSYYTHALDGTPVTLGLGIYAPHGASITWPQDTGFRAVAIKGDLTYLRFNPVVAVELLPGLSLAGGLMIDYGDITLAQGLRASPAGNSFRFDGDDWGAGCNLGLLWKVNEQVSLGATLRSGTTLEFEGRTRVELQPIIQPTALPAQAEFEFPWTAAVGISYRPSPEWNFEVNVDYTNWSSFDSVLIEQEGRPPFGVQQNIPFTLNWEDSLIYKVGVTRYFNNGWHASAGYLFNENSVPDDYYTPLVADLDRHFLSLGVGRKSGRLDFDVTYQFGFAPEHRVTGSTPPSSPANFAGQNADGTYDFTSHALLVSVGWKF